METINNREPSLRQGQERRARHQQVAVDDLKNMEAIPVPADNITKTAAKEIYKQIKQRQNKQTGQTAVFVNRAFWKILRHKGFDKRVIPILAEAFKKAIHMYDEPVKNNAAAPHVTSAIITTVTWGASGTTDIKLQQWLNFVKPNAEKST